jgi:uncharacterized membrane protein
VIVIVIELKLINMAFSDNIVYEALLKLTSQKEGNLITSAMIRKASGIDISRATVNRALTRLEAANQISRDCKWGKGNIYRIVNDSESANKSA